MVSEVKCLSRHCRASGTSVNGWLRDAEMALSPGSRGLGALLDKANLLTALVMMVADSQVLDTHQFS